jgi:hypothetical protein
MEVAIVTDGGHATEAQTERDRRIAVDSGLLMAVGITVVRGTTPATGGVAVLAQWNLLPAGTTPATLGRTRRMELTAMRVPTPAAEILAPQLTQARMRSQLSLHRPKRRQRPRRKLSGCANFKR